VYFNKPDETISIDTEYGRIIVENDNYNGQPVRFYKQSGAYSSATFLDQSKKYELVFDYLKKYDQMFNYLDAKNVAMIGGAAYQYPKYFISHFEDKNLDVIEIDSVSTEIAKKYFFLDDLINDYGDDRLGLYNADGRVFLDETDKKYDAILNDAFAGEVPVGTLATKEAAKIIKSRLTDGGVYMSNVLTSLEGEKSRFLRSEVKTLAEVFDNVYVVPIHKNVPETLFTNWMLIATDNDYTPADKITLETTDKDIVLTDDYCPVDSLVKTSYHD
jgi:spermidine synthase